MSFIESIKLRMYRYSLNKELRKRSHVVRASTPYDKANKIGILFDASDSKQEELVLQYVSRLRSKSKKTVDILGFFNDSEEREFDLYHFYTNKDINWLYFPNKADVKTFMEKQFDIAINFMENPPLHADYVMALSNSRMRVGRNTSNTEAYDLIINDRQKDSAHFIGLVDMYLKIFNQKKPNEPQAV